MSYIKKLPLISEKEFLEKASAIKEFISPNEKRYKVLSIEGDIMKFLRLDAESGKSESFSLLDVYLAYKTIDHFHTENFRPFVPRKHSPARALLLKLNLIR
jgi:hypothetical protein